MPDHPWAVGFISLSAVELIGHTAGTKSPTSSAWSYEACHTQALSFTSFPSGTPCGPAWCIVSFIPKLGCSVTNMLLSIYLITTISLTLGRDSVFSNGVNRRWLKYIHPKGNQSRIFIGRTDGEAETPIFWPPDVRYWLIGKDPDAWNNWGQEEKGLTEDQMVGWHHWLNRREFE